MRKNLATERYSMSVTPTHVLTALSGKPMIIRPPFRFINKVRLSEDEAQVSLFLKAP